MYLFDFSGIALAFTSQNGKGHLQELDLSNNDFVRIFSQIIEWKENWKQFFTNLFTNNVNLKKLKLKNNKLKHDQVKGLLAALKIAWKNNNLKKLRELDLS